MSDLKEIFTVDEMETLRDEAAPVDLSSGRGEQVPDLGRPAGGVRAQHGDLVQGALLHGGLDQSALSVEAGGPMRADLDEPEDQLEHAAGPHHVRGLQSLGIVALVDGDQLAEEVQGVHVGGGLATQIVPLVEFSFSTFDNCTFYYSQYLEEAFQWFPSKLWMLGFGSSYPRETVLSYLIVKLDICLKFCWKMSQFQVWFHHTKIVNIGLHRYHAYIR